MVYEICLSLEIKYCHVVRICCSRRFHNDTAECPVIAHQIVCCSICHLLSPVCREEHVVRSVIISVLILLPVIVRSFCKAVAFKHILVIKDLNAVHLADYDIIALLIAYRQIIRIAVLILDRNSIAALHLAYEETVVSPSYIYIVAFHPHSGVDIFPRMRAVRRVNISDKGMSDICKRTCRRVGNRRADTFAAADASISFRAVEEVVFIPYFCHLACPCGYIVVSPADVLHGHNRTFIFPLFQIFGRIAQPSWHCVIFTCRHILSYISIYSVAIYHNGRVAAVYKSVLAVYGNFVRSEPE